MNMRQLGLTVAGIVGLVIAFLIGRSLRVAGVATTNPADRTVWISASPDSPTDCVVNFPVASLKQNVNRIEWASTDKPYWVSFLTLGETVQNYTPESPLRPQKDPVAVPASNTSGNTSGFFNVKFDPQGGPPPKYGDPNYYMYAIYDHDPTTNPNNPCKKASIEHDTGVIVKR